MEIAQGQPPRLRQHRLRDRDVLVPGQAPDHLDRRSVDGSEAVAELDQRPALDTADQEAQHIVEDLDLLVVQPVGVVDKQVGDPPQRLGPVLQEIVLDRQFELGDERFTSRWHGMVLQCLHSWVHDEAGKDASDRRSDRPNLAIAIQRSVRPPARAALCRAMCCQPVKNLVGYFYLR